MPVLGLILLLPVFVASCSSTPEPKTVVKTSPTGKTKWRDLWEGVGQPVTQTCQLEEWKTEWSDGSTDYKWKSLGCRPMQDFEKQRHESQVQKVTPSQSPSSTTPYTPNNTPDKDDKIVKTVDCVSVLGVSEAVEFHYESGRIEVVITGGQVDLRDGAVPRWCVAERP